MKRVTNVFCRFNFFIYRYAYVYYIRVLYTLKIFNFFLNLFNLYTFFFCYKFVCYLTNYFDQISLVKIDLYKQSIKIKHSS